MFPTDERSVQLLLNLPVELIVQLIAEASGDRSDFLTGKKGGSPPGQGATQGGTLGHPRKTGLPEVEPQTGSDGPRCREIRIFCLGETTDQHRRTPTESNTKTRKTTGESILKHEDTKTRSETPGTVTGAKGTATAFRSPETGGCTRKVADHTTDAHRRAPTMMNHGIETADQHRRTPTRFDPESWPQMSTDEHRSAPRFPQAPRPEGRMTSESSVILSVLLCELRGSNLCLLNPALCILTSAF